MDSSNTLLGGLIFILLVVGANFVMYAVVRGATRTGGRKSFLETFTKSLDPTAKKKNDSMDELHRKLDELKRGKNEAGEDSE
ncbi:MAG TPA: hypothetical protein PLF42_00050 [Anaerolineales bacterium]|nr:hypothetical protein [Anaerolineales bacterium]